MCDVKWALENHCEAQSADRTSHINNWVVRTQEGLIGWVWMKIREDGCP